MHERKQRSALKALTWRVLATLITILLIFIVTGRLTLSIGVGIVELSIKLFLYYLHERAWDHIDWGTAKE